MRAIALALCGVLLLAGCGSNSSKTPVAPVNQAVTTPAPDATVCETAMRIQYNRALNDPDAPSATRPPECDGISDAVVEQIANKILAESLGD